MGFLGGFEIWILVDSDSIYFGRLEIGCIWNASHSAKCSQCFGAEGDSQVIAFD